MLATHPAVSVAPVIGVPDEKRGEAVKVVVVLKPGQAADPAELIALVRSRKGPVYAPKSLELVESLPLTPVGELDKKALSSSLTWSTRGVPGWRPLIGARPGKMSVPRVHRGPTGTGVAAVLGIV